MLVSMTAFWVVIQELLNITQPDHLVEIGGDQGECTQKLCAWASLHQAYVHVIETWPTNALRNIVEQYQLARLHVGPSLEFLPAMKAVACFVIDGDHNYYTVYNELNLIFQHNKPDLILLHDVGWPWGQRDLYYNLDAIPNAYRHKPVTDPNLGIIPGHPGVFRDQGFRSSGQFAFASTEGGPKNGVLAAAQDFLVENSDYELLTVDCVFGLGIIVPKSTPHYARIVTVLNRYVDNPLISLLEEDRLQTFIEALNKSQSASAPIAISANAQAHRLAYIDLMKRTLMDLVYSEPDELVMDMRNKQMIPRRDAHLSGLVWPERALTMMGLERLNNLQFCIEDVLHHGIPGDFIETGVWRGGACIFMRAILKAHDVVDRIVWAADSFRGLPKPDGEHYPLDEDLDLSKWPELAVSRREVADNFERFGLLDDQVRFLEGWFKDSLAVAPIEKLAILHLDGDLYQSTMEALVALYPRLMPGGYVIVDDYGAVQQCRQAVHDYRNQHGIKEEIRTIDWTGIYWQRI